MLACASRNGCGTRMMNDGIKSPSGRIVAASDVFPSLPTSAIATDSTPTDDMGVVTARLLCLTHAATQSMLLTGIKP